MSTTDRQPGEHFDLDPPPTEEELREAARLRDALEGNGSHEDAEWLSQLRTAYDPPELDPAENEWLVAGALARAKRRKWLGRLGGASAVLALAASVALIVTGEHGDSRQVRWRLCRTTEPIVAGTPWRGNASARMDRIVLARGRDYRQNMFAQWGVR